jgi:hypothetical protein
LEGTGGEGGTADTARALVQTYFQQLLETLQLQEAAAMTAVDTYIRERLCSLRQLQEDLATSLSQVNIQICWYKIHRVVILQEKSCI